MGADPNTNLPPCRPGQFTLQSLILVFVALQVLLGFTVFLKHVGFVLSCFAIATGLGWRLRKWRLMAAALTGLLVFLATYVACWVGMGYQSQMHYRVSEYARHGLIEIESRLAEYAEEKGEFPDSLRDLADLESFNVKVDEHGNVSDWWGHPYHYKKTAEGFELAILGRDGAFGGTGLDADIYLSEDRNLPESRLPPKQYLFETAGSGSVFFVAVVASLCATSTWYGAHQKFDSGSRPLSLGVLATTVAAVVVAFFLAGIHIAASQSGH